METPPAGPWASLEDLLDEVGDRESQWLEFKQALPKASDLQDPFVAFANSSGGLVVLGVTDKPPRVLRGVPDTQDTLERIQEAARITQPPLKVDAALASVGDKTVCLAAVPPLRQGFVQTSAGRLLVRAGPVKRALVGADLVEFVKERSGGPAEDEPVATATFDDLDLQAMKNFLKMRLSRPRADTKSTMRDLGFLVGDRPTVAGLLLFGKQPQGDRRRFGIDLLRYEGTHASTHALRDREQLTGRLPELVTEADRRVYDLMRRDAVVRGLVREEVPEYPTIAIREALLNAVGHRDYNQKGAAVQLRVFDDVIEIESPGTLPSVVSLENLKDAQYSRNPRIMDSFHVLHLVEEAGEGIDRMLEAMADALLAEPEFQENDGSFVVRLRSGGVLRAEDRMWLDSLEGVPAGPDARLALVHARRHGHVTNEELRGLRPLQPTAAREVLQTLVSRGLLESHGSGRGTRYELSSKAAGAIAPASLDANVSTVVSHARRVGAVANRDVRGLIGVDREEALRILEETVAAGYLTPEGNRRARKYLPTERREAGEHQGDAEQLPDPNDA